MKIRRVGLKFQLLQKEEGSTAEHIKYSLLGKVPIKCTSIDMVQDSILNLLSPRETLQFKRYIEKYHLNKTKLKEKESNDNVFQMLSTVNLELMDKVEYKNTEHNREAYLEACEKVTKSLCVAGYAPEVLDVVLSTVSDSIKNNELEADQAKLMIRAWLGVRKILNKQGYSSKWYNIARKSDTTK